MPYVGVMLGMGVIAFAMAHLKTAMFNISAERQGREYRTGYLRAVLRQVRRCVCVGVGVWLCVRVYVCV